MPVRSLANIAVLHRTMQSGTAGIRFGIYPCGVLDCVRIVLVFMWFGQGRKKYFGYVYVEEKTMFQQITKLVPYRARKFVKRVLGYGGKEFNASKEYVLLVSEKPRFQGKTAIVTGGSGAIGRAISLRLALEGAKVFVAGRTKSKVQDVVDEIRVLGALAYPVLMDVTNPTSVEKAFQMIMNHEGTQSLDIVVNCAGGSSRDKAARLHEQSIDVIDNILSTNLRGSLLCSRQAAKYMVGQDSGRYQYFVNSRNTRKGKVY